MSFPTFALIIPPSCYNERKVVVNKNAMSLKNFLYFISALFTLKVIFIIAAWLGWGLDIWWSGWSMPVWMAVLGLLVDALIAWEAFILARKV